MISFKSAVKDRKNLSEFFRKPYFFIIIIIVLLFAPVIIELAKYWSTNDDYSHGFFIIPISLYMVWCKRQVLFSLSPNPQWAGLPIAIIASLAYIISFIVKFHTLSYLSMIVLIFGLLIFLVGWTITKELLAPLLFLVFMFPIPSAYYVMLTNPLKLFITHASVLIIRLFEIPIYQEGNLIFMSDLQLEVAEACSGVRSLYSYLMLSCLFAWLSQGFFKRSILIFSAIPLAIGINILRVSITGILANFYGEQVAQGFFHEFAGLVLFGVGFACLLLEYLYINSNTGGK